MTVRWPALRPNHGLAALALLLAGLAAWPFLLARAAPPPRPAAAAVPAPGLAALPPIGRFSGIAERPLFSPSRRPAAADRVGHAGGGIDTRYRLLGVLIAGHERRALLLEGARRFELGVGDRLEGYTVARIEQNRVVLGSAAGDAILPLRPAAEAPAKVPR